MIAQNAALAVVLGILISSTTYASLSTRHFCQDEFIGRVVEIDDPETPLILSERERLLKKIFVKFEVQEVFKGALSKSLNVTIRLLKFGPVNVEKGQNYKVSLNKGKICQIKKQ